MGNHPGLPEGITCVLKTADSVPHEIGICFLLREHKIHPLENMGMNITCHISEIGRDVPFYEGTVNITFFMIDFLHDPDPPGNGYFVSYRRRLYDGAEFF